MQLTEWGLQEGHLVAVIIFCISFTGSIGNLLVAIHTLRFPSMRNSFGLLLASQSIGEAVLCSLFAFYYSPMVFFDIHTMKANSRYVGIILAICYDMCILSHLFISLGRMYAICFPLEYRSYFSTFNTKIFIIFTWIAGATRCLISYEVFDCDFVYDDNVWAFLFTRTEECKFISSYIDFFKDVAIVVAIAAVDTVAIVKVLLVKIQSRQRSRNSMDAKRRKEINFLKQTVLQNVAFVVGLLCYFKLAWKFKNHWVNWALTTVVWNVVHCSDSLIIIGFNAEFRTLIASPRNIFKIKNYVTNWRSTGSTAVK
ncbi:hypothetical protein Y032_0097g2996 [Ancylostoma ceylanicum]|uniref:G-protein coupled receptors family 1 profile domain-containing protein n=1 Tax=Ancylostoma ceylanicum TaxID=53326 RepID=A0A016TJP1_9BILA|nr:hypothetical protein Y032_0097g2996 [Ancylostoma ceylanicum]